MSPYTPVIFALIFFNPVYSDNGAKFGKVNEEVMDFAIAIHYGFNIPGYTKLIEPSPTIPVDNLLDFLDLFIDHFVISPDKTRVALVEFGNREKVLLPLEEGVIRANFLMAMEEIGQGSYTQPMRENRNLAFVAERTRKLAFSGKSKDRAHVPEVVLIIMVASEHVIRQWNTPTYGEDLRQLLKQGAHVLQMHAFNTSIGVEAGILYRHYFRVHMEKNFECKYYVTGELWYPRYWPRPQAAAEVAKYTKYCLTLCPYNRSQPKEECFYHEDGDCVTNVYYNVHWDWDNTGNRPELDKVPADVRLVPLLYCFKNGSTVPCWKGEDYCRSATAKCEENGVWVCDATCEKTVGLERWIPDNETFQNCTRILGTRPCKLEVECEEAPEDILARRLDTVIMIESIILAVLLPIAGVVGYYAVRRLKQDKQDKALLEKWSGPGSGKLNVSGVSKKPSPKAVVKAKKGKGK